MESARGVTAIAVTTVGLNRPVAAGPDGLAATDAVVVAATGRGPRCRFAGPVSDLGRVVARGARRALARAVARWLEEHV